MKFAFLLIFVFLAGFNGQAAPAEIFVAADGRDTNSGTKRKPYATLERARDQLRKLKAKKKFPPQGAIIWIRAGTYPLTKTFELSEQDSGSTNAPVFIRAFDDQQPRLIGGVELLLSDFHPVTDPTFLRRLDVSARTNVLEIELRKFGVTDFGGLWPEVFRGYNGWPELFCEGTPMHLARWPNAGFARMGAVLDSGSKPRYGEKPDRPGKFTYEGNRPERWLTSDEIFLDGFWSYKWYNECLKVAKVLPAEHTILFAAPHLYGVGGPSGG
ncbi:MAG: hypothetical protein JWO95_3715, partial [Verrucomicrobiales bacterium]|nr:hypothetical protein [Verrucomicrobiales bacterium]